MLHGCVASGFSPRDAGVGEVLLRVGKELVMGVYGHSRIRELTLGSSTTAMARTRLVPVLMFRQPDP